MSSSNFSSDTDSARSSVNSSDSVETNPNREKHSRSVTSARLKGKSPVFYVSPTKPFKRRILNKGRKLKEGVFRLVDFSKAEASNSVVKPSLCHSLSSRTVRQTEPEDFPFHIVESVCDKVGESDQVINLPRLTTGRSFVNKDFNRDDVLIETQHPSANDGLESSDESSESSGCTPTFPKKKGSRVIARNIFRLTKTSRPFEENIVKSAILTAIEKEAGGNVFEDVVNHGTEGNHISALVGKDLLVSSTEINRVVENILSREEYINHSPHSVPFSICSHDYVDGEYWVDITAEDDTPCFQSWEEDLEVCADKGVNDEIRIVDLADESDYIEHIRDTPVEDLEKSISEPSEDQIDVLRVVKKTKRKTKRKTRVDERNDKKIDTMLDKQEISRVARRACCIQNCLFSLGSKGVKECREEWLRLSTTEQNIILQVSINGGSKENQRHQFKVKNRFVCRGAVKDIYQVGNNRLNRLRDIPLGSKVERSLRESTSAFHDTTQWLSTFFIKNVEQLPNKTYFHLPDSYTKKEVYEVYLGALRGGSVLAMSYSYFCRVWNTNFNRVKIPRKNRFSICSMCAELKGLRDKTMKSEEKGIPNLLSALQLVPFPFFLSCEFDQVIT